MFAVGRYLEFPGGLGNKALPLQAGSHRFQGIVLRVVLLDLSLDAFGTVTGFMFFKQGLDPFI